MVKTLRKTKIMHITRKQNNAQAFVNLDICPIILFCRQYFKKSLFDFIFL